MKKTIILHTARGLFLSKLFLFLKAVPISVSLSSEKPLIVVDPVLHHPGPLFRNEDLLKLISADESHFVHGQGFSPKQPVPSDWLMRAYECQVPPLNLGQLKSAIIDSELPEKSVEVLLGMLCISVSSLVLHLSIPSQLFSRRNFLQASFHLRVCPMVPGQVESRYYGILKLDHLLPGWQ